MAQKKTYRIEYYWEDQKTWNLSNTWYGMPRGKTDGALMVLDAGYGGKLYRAICEQTDEVYRIVGGRSMPTPTQNIDSEFTDIVNECFWDLM